MVLFVIIDFNEDNADVDVSAVDRSGESRVHLD